MFLEHSRYHGLETVEVTGPADRKVTALKLRRLPTPNAAGYTVKSIDQLDLLAHKNYGNATTFWHIADANSELEAESLTAITGRNIHLPTA